MGVCGNQMKIDVKHAWDSASHLSKLSEFTVITTNQKLSREQIILNNFAKTVFESLRHC